MGRPAVFIVVLPTRHQLMALKRGADEAKALFPQQQIAEFCVASGIPCLDPVPAIREAGLPSPSAIYQSGDALHFNEAGHQLIARILWPQLVELLRDTSG